MRESCLAGAKERNDGRSTKGEREKQQSKISDNEAAFFEFHYISLTLLLEELLSPFLLFRHSLFTRGPFLVPLLRLSPRR